MTFIVRRAVLSDSKEINEMLMELLEFDNIADQKTYNVKDIEEAGFGKDKYFECFVAEIQDGALKGKLVGLSLYFKMFSSTDGKSLYMEDLFVKAEYRRKGIGRALLKNVAKAGIEMGCSRIQWMVKSSNTPAVEFYKRNGGTDITADEGFHVFSMLQADMKKLII